MDLLSSMEFVSVAACYRKLVGPLEYIHDVTNGYFRSFPSRLRILAFLLYCSIFATSVCSLRLLDTPMGSSEGRVNLMPLAICCCSFSILLRFLFKFLIKLFVIIVFVTLILSPRYLPTRPNLFTVVSSIASSVVIIFAEALYAC